MKNWFFYWFLAFGLIWIGLGIDEILRGDSVMGWLQLAIGVLWIVTTILRRKGILPAGSDRKPPLPNPYQENLPQ